MQRKTKTVETLLDALPFIKQFFGETVVIKYGGSAQEDPKLKEKFAQDILLLFLVGIKPVVVHGGGKNITNLHNDLKVATEFKDGVRVTSKESMRIAEMVLNGEINGEIVSLINHHGAKAIGMSGKDANAIMAEPLRNDLGYTGRITKINADVIQRLIDDRFIPVIAPIAASSELGHPGYNINADTMASEIAVALKAKKVIFLTDIVGVLDENKELLSTLTFDEIEDLKQKGIIHGGMIPKVEACTDATSRGVEKAHIIDGRVEHSMLLEIFTSDGIGTVIKH